MSPEAVFEPLPGRNLLWGLSWTESYQQGKGFLGGGLSTPYPPQGVFMGEMDSRMKWEGPVVVAETGFLPLPESQDGPSETLHLEAGAQASVSHRTSQV